MKKIISVLVSAMLVLSLTLTAFAYRSIVDDSANLFDYYEAESITDKTSEFCSETGLSIAIVTTDYTAGKTTADFAEDYCDELGWLSQGLFLLIDMDNRVILADAVGNTYDDFSKSDISYISDCGYDEAANGNYADAILNMIDAAIEVHGSVSYEGGYDYDYDYDYDESVYDDSSSPDLGNIPVYIVIGLVIAAITVLIVKSRYKNNGKGDEFDTDDVILKLTGSNDTVISRNVVTTKIPKNNNNGRPGSGGTVHRSSSRKF